MGLEFFVLMLFIVMGATAIVYSVEIYTYLSFVLGAVMRDIKNFINTSCDFGEIFLKIVLANCQPIFHQFECSLTIKRTSE